MEDETEDLDLPEDLEDVEVIYSDGEYDENDEMDEINNTEDVVVNDMSKYTFTKHNKSVFTVDISPNQQCVVTGSEDDSAYVWNLNTREVLFECTGHKDSITEACFNHDGQYVATGDMSGMVQVWHVDDNKLVWCNEGDDLEWMCWHPLTNVLIIGCRSGDIYIWQVPQSNCKVLPSHGCATSCGKVLPDGKKLVSGYEDGQIKLWDIKAATTIWQLSEPCSAGIISLDMNSDGTLLAVAPTSQLILLNDGRVIGNLHSNTNKDVEAILMSSEIGVLVTGALSGELCVWDLGKHMLRHQARIESSVTVIKWGRDGKVFVGATDGAIYLCDVRSGTLLNTFTGHKKDILDIAIPKSGQYILSSSDDCTVKIFDV
ncbi:hypothetical protein HHI36_005951 [Cryptolaemus montrouzieri]|uniref:Angio-associated migratory cell protein n=1 Tax=Cryptolaemus montrouzieri TaxID=559131 RepID=A0ABD2NVT3_9CUCU